MHRGVEDSKSSGAEERRQGLEWEYCSTAREIREGEQLTEAKGRGGLEVYRGRGDERMRKIARRPEPETLNLEDSLSGSRVSRPRLK